MYQNYACRGPKMYKVAWGFESSKIPKLENPKILEIPARYRYSGYYIVRDRIARVGGRLLEKCASRKERDRMCLRRRTKARLHIRRSPAYDRPRNVEALNYAFLLILLSREDRTCSSTWPYPTVSSLRKPRSTSTSRTHRHRIGERRGVCLRTVTTVFSITQRYSSSL